MLKQLGLSIDIQNIIQRLALLLFVIHLVGNALVSAASFNLDDNTNWITEAHIEDESIVYIYVTATYWAIVTLLAVGYGDSIPTNTMELQFVSLLILIGVGLMSFILSASTQ